MMWMREIRFYRTPSGDSPVEEFLDSLPGKTAQKIVWVMRLVEELERVPASYLKKLTGTDDIWEIRIQVGNDTYRILSFFDGEGYLVLNHAFQKKTPKIPARYIRLAESRKREYLNKARGE